MGLKSWVQFLATEIFLLSETSALTLGCIQLLVKRRTGVFSLSVKRPGRELEYLHAVRKGQLVFVVVDVNIAHVTAV
jgi:hypothetical protein